MSNTIYSKSDRCSPLYYESNQVKERQREIKNESEQKREREKEREREKVIEFDQWNLFSLLPICLVDEGKLNKWCEEEKKNDTAKKSLQREKRKRVSIPWLPSSIVIMIDFKTPRRKEEWEWLVLSLIWYDLIANQSRENWKINRAFRGIKETVARWKKHDEVRVCLSEHLESCCIPHFLSLSLLLTVYLILFDFSLLCLILKWTCLIDWECQSTRQILPLNIQVRTMKKRKRTD